MPLTKEILSAYQIPLDKNDLYYIFLTYMNCSFIIAPEYQQQVNEPADFTLIMASGTGVVCKPSQRRKPEAFYRPNTRDMGSIVKKTIWVPGHYID